MTKIAFARCHPDAKPPHRASPDAVGWDIHAVEGCMLRARERALVRTGLRMAIPPGFEIQIRPRSGLALRHGITVLNSPGTIDPDYRGELGVVLLNTSNEAFRVKTGDRIAQVVLTTYSLPEWDETDVLPESTRGVGGFGHTGT